MSGMTVSSSMSASPKICLTLKIIFLESEDLATGARRAADIAAGIAAKITELTRRKR